jgi:hypothetical protein
MGYSEETDLESGEKVLFVAFTVETSLLKDDEGFKSVLAHPKNVRYFPMI